MRSLIVLASLSFACAGGSRAPARPCPDCPDRTCPACPDATCPTCPACAVCPACPTCPSRYADTEGWYCVDDPPTKDGPKAYSYCWPTQAYCDYAYKKYVKDRPWVKPCRPHTPVYCYELFSPQFQARRFSCSATMEHCEAHQKSVLGKLEPDGDYRWTQCTEQP